MSKSNWTWTVVLAGSAAVAWFSCSSTDSTVVFWDAVVKLFIYAFFLWIVCSVLSNVYKAFAKQSTQVSVPEVPEERKQWLKELRNKSRQSMQKETNERGDSYRERIMVPREKARRKKQDGELNLIMGHTFRGNGQQLAEGEDVPDNSEHRDNVNQVARERRRLPPDVILHRPKPEPTPEPEKKKRVIELPEEPDVGEDDTVTVTIHTPLSQRKSRRFHSSCTLQVIMDYMTTLGFTEAYYTLSSSYPRKQLTDDVEKTLKELGFQKRTLLYVEKKD